MIKAIRLIMERFHEVIWDTHKPNRGVSIRSPERGGKVMRPLVWEGYGAGKEPGAIPFVTEEVLSMVALTVCQTVCPCLMNSTSCKTRLINQSILDIVSMRHHSHIVHICGLIGKFEEDKLGLLTFLLVTFIETFDREIGRVATPNWSINRSVCQ